MKLQIEKIKSYVGFAIKSRQIRFGVDEISKLKNAKIIIYSSNLGPSSKRKLEEYATKSHIDIFEIDSENFSNIVLNQKILALAVTEENLAKAIKLNIN